MSATMEAPVIYTGRFRGDGHIISATSELLSLHRRCGGADHDVLALPGLPSLIRRAASLGMPLSASVLLADGQDNVTYWARAVPSADGVDLQLFDWDGSGSELSRAFHHAVRERDFMRSSTDWLWEVDAALCFTSLADSAAAVFGQPAAMLIGKPMTAYLRPAGTSGEVEFRSGSDPLTWFKDLVVEVRGAKPPRFFQLSGRPVYDGERLMGLRGTAVEVPEPSEAPAAAAQPSVSHPPTGRSAFPATDMLRQPLDQITRQAEAIRAQSFGHLKSVYAGYAGDIATAARHLRTLIDDVFDVAAIESGTVGLAIEKVDLTTLAEEARAIVSQRAAASGSRTLWRSPPASVIVRADWGRTLQILINLMQNAVKFAGESGPVRLSLEPDESDVRFHVDDAGPGIPAEARERVFSKFERLQPDREGSGLGLYISRALARAMGGDIIVSEAPEGGARFTVVLARA